MGTTEPTAAPTPPPGSRALGETRRRVYDVVSQFPGLRAIEISRESRTPENLTRYHLYMLVREGLVIEGGEGTESRYHAVVASALGTRPALGRDDQRALNVLRRMTPLAMALYLLENPELPRTMTELAQAVEVGRPTATYHVSNLRRAGLVDVDASQRERYVRLADAARVRRLLSQYPPPRDVVQSFIDLWDRLDL